MQESKRQQAPQPEETPQGEDALADVDALQSRKRSKRKNRKHKTDPEIEDIHSLILLKLRICHL